MKTIPIAEATDRELFRFATETLGMNVHPMTGRDKLIARIKSAHEKDTITVPDEEPKTIDEANRAQAGDKGKAGRVGDPEPRVLVTIDSQDVPGGKEPVFVSVNGVGMTINRDTESEIKFRYFEVLQHAVKIIYDEVDEGVHKQMVERKVPMYPVRVLRMPPQAEIDAWLAGQSNQAAA